MQYINRSYKRTGSRGKAAEIQRSGRTYLLTCMRYINIIPFVPASADLAEFRWSSHRHNGRGQPDPAHPALALPRDGPR